MHQWTAWALAGMTVGVAGSGPSFDTYSVALGAPALRMIVAPLDTGATPDAVVLVRSAVDEVGLVSLSGAGTGRLSPSDVSLLQQVGYLNTPSIAAADVDGNGLLDFGVNAIVSEQIFFGDGDLSYSGTGFLPTAGGSQHGLDFTDVDGDGDSDSVLLVDDFGDWFLDVGLNDGAGNFSATFGPNAPGTPRTDARLLFVDDDNDGMASTFVVGGSGLAKSAYPGGPSTNELLVAGTLGEVQAAHLDGDAFIDLVVASPSEGGVFVLLNDGAGNFPSAQFIATGRLPESLALGDVTGDGACDIAVANRRSGDVTIHAGDGSGGFTLAATVDVASDPVAIALSDLDADNDLDLVVAGGTSMRLTVALNQGP